LLIPGFFIWGTVKEGTVWVWDWYRLINVDITEEFTLGIGPFAGPYMIIPLAKSPLTVAVTGSEFSWIERGLKTLSPWLSFAETGTHVSIIRAAIIAMTMARVKDPYVSFIGSP